MNTTIGITLHNTVQKQVQQLAYTQVSLLPLFLLTYVILLSPRLLEEKSNSRHYFSTYLKVFHKLTLVIVIAYLYIKNKQIV